MKIYQFCNGMFGPSDYVWVAMSEEGEVIKTHVSSSRSWGISDTGPKGLGRSVYEKRFGADFEEKLTFVVCDEGSGPPDEVMERNRAWAEAADA